MGEDNQLIKICLYYQMFMGRAYGSYALQKPVLQALGMRNLIMAEKGILISGESVIHFQEQLVEIKKHMDEALNHYMAAPNTPEYIIEELRRHKDQVAEASSSEELMKIVLNTLDLTNSLLKIEQ